MPKVPHLVLILASILILSFAIEQSSAQKGSNSSQRKKAEALESQVKSQANSDIKRSFSSSTSHDATRKVYPRQVEKLPDTAGKKISSIQQRSTNQSNEHPSKQFKARMMQDEQTQPLGSSQLFSASDDGWHPHNIMPTFSDMEQGDSMVALASSQADANEPILEAVPFRSTRANKPSPLASEYKQHSAEPITTNSNRSSKRPPLVEEYYGDSDSNADDDGALDQESMADQVLSQSKKIKPESVEDNKEPKFGRFAVESIPSRDYDVPSVVPEPASIQNKSIPKMTLPEASTWIPAVPTRPEATGERLAELFGSSASGAGSNLASKADIAIEYLRNVLKDKQQQQHAQAHNSSREHVRHYDDYHNPTQRNSSLHRLSSIANKLSQIMLINNGNNSSNASAHVNTEEAQLKKPQLVNLETNPSMSIGSSKFSLSDVKQTTVASFDYSSVSSPASPTVPASSGKLFDMQSLEMFSQSTQPANGSPLGGDYIESLDDYPRGAYPIAQNSPPSRPQIIKDQPQVLAMGSHQIPVVIDTHHHQQQQQQQQQQPRSIGYQVQQQHQADSIKTLHEPAISTRFFQMHQGQQHQTQQINPNPLIASVQHETLYHPEQVANKSQTVELAPVPIKPVQVKSAPISSKLYKEGEQLIGQVQQQVVAKPSAPSTPEPEKYNPQEQPIHQIEQRPINGGAEQQIHALAQMQQQQQHHHQQQQQQLEQPKARPPKIVSYNKFGENGEPTGLSDLGAMINAGDLLATNYQLGDALYSSTGGLEHALSQSELEAIQSQFLSAEHPVVPLPDHQQHPHLHNHHNHHHHHHHHYQRQQQHQQIQQDASLAGLPAAMKPFSPDHLQKLSTPEKQADEMIKELASNQEPERVPAPMQQQQHLIGAGQQLQVFPPQPLLNQVGDAQSHPILDLDNGGRREEVPAAASGEFSSKKKSLIVYLNHPTPIDLPSNKPKSSPFGVHSSDDQQTVGEFISAKEFDNHGLSKDNKQLDITNLRNLALSDPAIINQATQTVAGDKDGLSVVVIGDAYKYKKIVLLISSKPGGLKFIPMVKDMRK